MKTAAKKRRAAPARSPHRPRKPEPQRTAPAPQQSIIIRKPERDWIVQGEEITILKNAIAKGATDKEFEFCLITARRYRLDPFRKQIHFVPRWDREAERTDGEKGSKTWVPIVGIDGLLHIAARDHKDFGTFEEPEYGPMMDLSGIANRGTQYAKPFKIRVPEWCRVEGFKKGIARPTVGKLWWEEIYNDVSFAPTVRKMPRLMIAKCCVAHITRRSYPSTGGLLIEEEILGKREFQSFTPDGRILSAPDPSSPIVDAVPPAEAAYLKREAEQIAQLPKEAQERIAKQRERSAAVEREMLQRFTYKERPDGRFEIDGPDDLKKQHRDLLIPLCVREHQGIAILANPQQLGKFIAELERLRVPIHALDREPGE